MKNKILKKIQPFLKYLSKQELQAIQNCFIFEVILKIFLKKVAKRHSIQKSNFQNYSFLTEIFCYFYIVNFFHRQLLEKKKMLKVQFILIINKKF